MKTIEIHGLTLPVLAKTYGHAIAAHATGPVVVSCGETQTIENAVLGDDLSLLDRAMILNAYVELTWPLLVASLEKV